VVFYLTDVDESSHTFSVLPGSVSAAELPPLEAYDLESAQHLTGLAGTAILFNAALFHAGCVRETPRERRTIHIYCGRRSHPPLSNHTIFPRRLWEGQDEATQRYYSRPNQITRLMMERF
jgi:ectoine hydroxylase-related dioxygenase (phytanoyl-CoA dioxygenase family)